MSVNVDLGRKWSVHLVGGGTENVQYWRIQNITELQHVGFQFPMYMHCVYSPSHEGET